MYVAMFLDQTLLKLKEGASNTATRSLLAVWMDAVTRALCVDFAKDTESTIVAISSIVRITYSARICSDFIILQLPKSAQLQTSQSQCLLPPFL